MDPELEMVLRISLEEEKKRQEELARQKKTEGMNIETENDEEKQKLLTEAEQIANNSNVKNEET